MSLQVFSYFDANGLTRYLDGNDYVDTGAWSSATAYTAALFQVVTYGATHYICVTDNTNQAPTATNAVRYWSPLVLLYDYSGTVTPIETLGSAAYILATAGSNLAWDAYVLAQNGTTVAQVALEAANGAYALAVIGTNAAIQAQATAEAGTLAAAAALSTLSTGFSGTHTLWVAGSFSGPTNVSVTIINGLITVIA